MKDTKLNKKPYNPPKITYQQPMETRAGSSGGGPS